MAQLSKILSQLPPLSDSLVIFLCKKIPGTNAWKELVKMSSQITIKDLSIQDLYKWMYLESKKRGVNGISKDACNYVIKHVSDKVEDLDKIIEKASLLTKSDSEISLKTVLEITDTVIKQDTFDLFSAIAGKKRVQAHIILDSILESGTHPLQILGFFNKAIKTLLADSKSTHKLANENFADLKNSWFKNKLHSDKFNLDRLIRALGILSSLDASLKGKNIGEMNEIKCKLIDI